MKIKLEQNLQGGNQRITTHMNNIKCFIWEDGLCAAANLCCFKYQLVFNIYSLYTLKWKYFTNQGCCCYTPQVQAEIKRKWRRWHLQRYMRSDTKYQHPSIGSSNNFSTQITMLTRCSPKMRRGSSSCHDDLSSIWLARGCNTDMRAVQNHPHAKH